MSRWVEFRMETFGKWLSDRVYRLRPLDHSLVREEVEGIANDAWKAGHAEGRKELEAEIAGLKQKLALINDWSRL